MIDERTTDVERSVPRSVEPRRSGEQKRWTIVCVSCLRVHDGAQWTDERAPDTGGQSTGFCDACVEEQRRALLLEAMEVAGLIPPPAKSISLTGKIRRAMGLDGGTSGREGRRSESDGA